MNRFLARAISRQENAARPQLAADDLSWLHRSEAFAEDLQELVTPLPQWSEGAPQGRSPQLGGVGDGSSAKARAGQAVARPHSWGWQRA
ncbi:MAG: hypothetical protein KJ023_18285 [Burkholderiaceae bacterium]|jgi:hypothetical protein|nr:hypothetical protein [Burkholderiaceae bacterium]